MIGSIYKITSPHTTNVYVGSTSETIEKRFQKHLSDYKVYLNHTTRGNLRSFDIIALGDATISLIEIYPCANESELKQRENYWIAETPNTINCVNPIQNAKKKEHLRKFHVYYNMDLHTQPIFKPGQVQCDCGEFVSRSRDMKRHKT